MGYTWEVDCHLFYRRAKLLAVQAGGPGVWKEKLVRRLEHQERGLGEVIMDFNDSTRRSRLPRRSACVA